MVVRLCMMMVHEPAKDGHDVQCAYDDMRKEWPVLNPRVIVTTDGNYLA